jgi:hypothetical protein
MIGVAEQDLGARRAHVVMGTPLIEAWVPTGVKAGVCVVPYRSPPRFHAKDWKWRRSRPLDVRAEFQSQYRAMPLPSGAEIQRQQKYCRCNFAYNVPEDRLNNPEQN